MKIKGKGKTLAQENFGKRKSAEKRTSHIPAEEQPLQIIPLLIHLAHHSDLENITNGITLTFMYHLNYTIQGHIKEFVAKRNDYM